MQGVPQRKFALFARSENSAARNLSQRAKISSRRGVGLPAAPEPHDAPERGQPGGDRLRRPPRAVRRRRLRLALRGDLARVPDRPAEDGVPLVQHSHGARVPDRERAHTQQDAAPRAASCGERDDPGQRGGTGPDRPRTEEDAGGPEKPTLCSASPLELRDFGEERDERLGQRHVRERPERGALRTLAAREARAVVTAAEVAAKLAALGSARGARRAAARSRARPGGR